MRIERVDDYYGVAPDPRIYSRSRHYASMDEAAIAGGAAAALMTQETNKEYACGIYCDGDSYYLGEFIEGTHDGVNVQQCFEGPNKRAVSTVHSHPYCTGHNGNSFSTQFGGELIGDAKTAFNAGVPIYLAAPNGTLQKMEVIQRLGSKYMFDIIIISDCLPSDRTRINCAELEEQK